MTQANERSREIFALKAQNQKIINELSRVLKENNVLKSKLRNLMMAKLKLRPFNTRDESTQTGSISEHVFNTPPEAIMKRSSAHITPLASKIVTPDGDGFNPNFTVTLPVPNKLFANEIVQEPFLKDKAKEVLEFTEIESSLMQIDESDGGNTKPYTLPKSGRNRAASRDSSVSSDDSENYWSTRTRRKSIAPVNNVAFPKESFKSPSKTRVARVLAKRILEDTPSPPNNPETSTEIPATDTSMDVSVVLSLGNDGGDDYGDFGNEEGRGTEQSGQHSGLNDTFSEGSGSEAGSSSRSARRVRKPVSYKEPSLSAKVRRGYKFFKFET